MPHSLEPPKIDIFIDVSIDLAQPSHMAFRLTKYVLT